MGFLLSGFLAAPPAVAAPVVFSVTADVPYGAAEIPLLEQHLRDHDTYSPSSFLIHLGDINQASEGCHEDRYETMGELLRDSQVPAFVVPGDNEWIDCADPDQGWAWWEEHLGGLHTGFCFGPAVETQNLRPENFAFVLDGVLFVGLNRPAGVPADVTADDAAWVDAQFDAHASEVRAVVLMAHAQPDGALETAVEDTADAYGGPVLYLHGNGHGWQDQVGWLGHGNLRRVQVDMGAAAPPVEVTVSDAGTFTFDRDPWPIGTAPVVRGECAEPAPGEEAPAGRPVSVRIASDADDAEENVSSGVVTTSSTDLELVAEGGRAQVVGLRFTNVAVPAGATILSASVVFAVDETSTGAAPLQIRGQAVDDADVFTTGSRSLSSRTATGAVALWNPPDWTSVGADQRTTDLAAVVQEIVSRPGWAMGNDLALVLTGSGRRTAESYSGSAGRAALLDLVYADPPAADDAVLLEVGVRSRTDDAEEDGRTGGSDDRERGVAVHVRRGRRTPGRAP